MSVTVVVVDDQAVVREGLVLLLGLLPGIEVVGSAGDGEAALHLVAEQRPDVALMDLRMPRMDGVEATRRIRAEHPGTQVVVLTTYSDDESVFAALRAGARGFLTKSADSDEIAKAIATVVRGNAQLDPSVQRRLLDTMTAPDGGRSWSGQPDRADPATPDDGPPRGRQPERPDPTSPDGSRAWGQQPDRTTPAASDSGRPRGEQPDSDAHEQRDGLTPREVEVLRLIADGLSNTEIAARLFISEATVKTHINNLFAKARLRDRAQAVTYAYRHGLVRPDP